jgi:3-keto-disaccharide hydrolase
MRNLKTLCILIALGSCVAARAGQGPNVPHVEPKYDAASLDKVENTPPAGFTALFNGKDLTNWKGLLDPRKKLDNPAVRAKLSPEDRAKAQDEADQNMRQHWKVENGVLVFDGKGRNLCSEKLYGDFEMWVDWKIEPGGDSGIYVRGSPQVQIWDSANKPAGGIGSGGLYNNQKHDHDPDVFADRPVGQWNRFHIIMVGDNVTVFLNGNRVVDNVVLENYWVRSQPIFPTESIELQNHSSRLEFKNIYVREIERK